MPEPTATLQALRASTADLVAGLIAHRWSDDEMRADSLCAGWTRGHVLSHIARNADGVAGTLSGALRGEVVAQYPDGWDARDTAINDGADRPSAELIADVESSAERLDRVLGAIADADAWSVVADQDRTAAEWIGRRLREVEIHRVDLAGDYGPDRWPPALVSQLLSEVAETLADRLPPGVEAAVEVTAEGSVLPALDGTIWTAGSGEPVSVRGPDWAVLAWLVGRGSVATDALTAAPELAAWR